MAASKQGTASKTPLIAGGAALAGAAGGLLLGSRLSGRRVLGVPLPKPKRLQVIEQVGQIAGRALAAQGDDDSKRNSPLEVLLQGLTARR